MEVRIICSDEAVRFEGTWPDPVDEPKDVIAHCVRQALARDMPLQVEIYGGGKWSITPDGRVVPGALFFDEEGRPRRG